MKTREAFWRGALSDFAASGQSMRQFCRDRQLSYQRALHWRRQLSAPEEETISFAVLQLPQPGTTALASSPDSGVSVECGGHLVRLNRDFDESVLLRVVSILNNGREV